MPAVSVILNMCIEVDGGYMGLRVQVKFESLKCQAFIKSDYYCHWVASAILIYWIFSEASFHTPFV